MESYSAIIRATLVAWALCLCLAASPAAAGERIVILNWSDYLDPEVLAEFAAETGIHVEEVYFASDTDRDSMIVQADADAFDVVLIGGDRLQALLHWNYLSEISKREVPNLRHLDEKWLSLFPGAAGHSVPLFWGTTGIAYRSDLIDEDFSRWSQLFNVAASFCGRLQMFKDHRENIDVALGALGFDWRSPTLAQLEEARTLLLEQQACVADYDFFDVNEHADLISGDITVGVAYSGDVEVMREMEPAIRYVVPDENYKLWVDYFIVPVSSSRKSAAFAFLNFINRPEIAARLAESHNYAPANLAAHELLSPEFRANPTIFPPASLIDRGTTESAPSARILHRYNAIAMELDANWKSAQ